MPTSLQGRQPESAVPALERNSPLERRAYKTPSQPESRVPARTVLFMMPALLLQSVLQSCLTACRRQNRYPGGAVVTFVKCPGLRLPEVPGLFWICGLAIPAFVWRCSNWACTSTQ